MTSFTTLAAAPLNGAADPTKHVNYVQGMILGVDDLTQEFAYLSNRDRWLARDLIGYGTVWGLRVGLEPGSGDVQVMVSRGAALTPCGQLICVDSDQCASINAWLSAHSNELHSQPDNVPLPVYVVLSYRETIHAYPSDTAGAALNTLFCAQLWLRYRLQLGVPNGGSVRPRFMQGVITRRARGVFLPGLPAAPAARQFERPARPAASAVRWK